MAQIENGKDFSGHADRAITRIPASTKVFAAKRWVRFHTVSSESVHGVRIQRKKFDLTFPR